jgi:hypothetical protein
MALDSPKLPRAPRCATTRLYVEGEKEPYFQDREHTIWLRVAALTIYRGYRAYDRADMVLTESLHGIAKLEHGNRFAVIGLEPRRFETQCLQSPAWMRGAGESN